MAWVGCIALCLQLLDENACSLFSLTVELRRNAIGNFILDAWCHGQAMSAIVWCPTWCAMSAIAVYHVKLHMFCNGASFLSTTLQLVCMVSKWMPFERFLLSSVSPFNTVSLLSPERGFRQVTT